MALDTRLSVLTACGLVKDALSSVRTYKANFERKLEVLRSPTLEAAVNNLAYVEALLGRVARYICSPDASAASAFSAFNLLDEAYPRIMGEQSLPSAVKASVYEIYRVLREAVGF